MQALVQMLEHRLSALPVPVQLRLPGGEGLGAANAAVRLEFADWASIGAFVGGQIGCIAELYVQRRLEIEGRMRDVMAAAVGLLPASPVDPDARWWQQLVRRARSLSRHTPERDAEQVRFHYDVCDDFYALWLDPRRVYSCAYFRTPEATLAQAQEAKLAHICRKLMLAPGERFLDIGAGWGGLLLWAAEQHGVDATGITLSRNQHAHVQRLVQERGLAGRVRVLLCDYRELDEGRPFDKIASVGMFEHVGQAQMAAYFGKIHRLLRPGGLVLNHGITSGSTGANRLGAGMGEFIGRYIFPGGELLHVSQVQRELASAGLEMLDTENLRPHYARTLWAWSDALEARLEEAKRVLQPGHGAEGAETVLRAYRLYLAGCAMCFEQGWTSLHQLLASRPDGRLETGALRGAQCAYPYTRDFMYR
jgi:cyclopropane-fatty-acyl-phospholipid synthase